MNELIGLIILVVVLALVSIGVTEIKHRLYLRRVAKAIALIKAENQDFDANALRCALEADRQRRHHDHHDDDDRGTGPFMMAA